MEKTDEGPANNKVMCSIKLNNYSIKHVYLDWKSIDAGPHVSTT